MVKRMQPLDGFRWLLEKQILVPSHHPVACFLSKCRLVCEVVVDEYGGPEPPPAHTIPIGSIWLSGYGHLMDLCVFWQKMYLLSQATILLHVFPPSKCRVGQEVAVGEYGGPKPPHTHAIPIGSIWLSGYGRLVDSGD